MRYENEKGYKFEGRIGDVVASTWKGIKYVKEFKKPANPRTEKQQRNRKLFKEAIEKWQRLPKEEKEKWNKKAAEKKLSGYNLMIKQYIKMKSRNGS